ncbi:MAG: hypothetical protein Q9162_002432 [Coniocarpon cinnabarinum]
MASKTPLAASEKPESSITDAAIARRSQDPVQFPLELIIKILDIYWRSIIDEMNGGWLPRSVRPVFCLSKSTLLYALTTITKMLEEARARIDDIEKWYPQYIHTEYECPNCNWEVGLELRGYGGCLKTHKVLVQLSAADHRKMRIDSACYAVEKSMEFCKMTSSGRHLEKRIMKAFRGQSK